MSMDLTPLTPYPEVTVELNKLLDAIQIHLRSQLVGLYVHGSLASGDFHPLRSDIDFLIVTEGEIPLQKVTELARMHVRLAAEGSKWTRKMEGSYIPLADIRRYNPNNASHPTLRIDGTLTIDFHASDWIIQRAIIRERGIGLYGPDPKSLIDPVTAAELGRAARGILAEWWHPQLTDHSRLVSREYQAYAVLTMCRCLYTINTGAVASKEDAARQAQILLGEPWAGLIERALAWPNGQQLDELAAVLDFIRLTLGKARLTA